MKFWPAMFWILVGVVSGVCVTMYRHDCPLPSPPTRPLTIFEFQEAHGIKEDGKIGDDVKAVWYRYTDYVQEQEIGEYMVRVYDLRGFK